ncbi:MAG: CAP domain-containing protein [Candidatus Pacebacteria bacterium]|nr:CAP domain-containing protein [Candidatus Paceibacterota bacterium]
MPFFTWLKNLFIPCNDNNFRPKILEGKYLIYILLLACFLRLTTFVFFWQLPNTSFFADISRTILIDSLNQERTGLKLATLKENILLNQSALLKAQDMMANGYFSHTSPSGITPWYWFSKVGYNYKAAGENLGIGFVDSAALHQAWNDSPSHQANLLSNNYKDIGIAFVEGNFNGSPTTIVVQHFGTQKIIPAVKPKPATITVKPGTTSSQATANLSLNLATTASSVAGEASYLVISATSGLASLTTTTANPETKKSFWAGILKFLVKDYNSLTQKIVLIFLVINITALILNIVIKIFVQHYDLILKATLISIALILLIAISPKEIIALIQPYAKIF